MIYIDNRQGHRVETQDDKADPVLFFPQGGGFQCSMAHSRFHAAFTLEAAPPTWRAGTVTAEWFATDEGSWPGYPCWSSGDLWNGFGMPFFTAATINQMLAEWANSGFAEQVHWVDGKLMMINPQENETYEVAPTRLVGLEEPLYGLGAGSWTWDQVVFASEPPDLSAAAESLALIRTIAKQLQYQISYTPNPGSSDGVAFRFAAATLRQHLGKLDQQLKDI